MPRLLPHLLLAMLLRLRPCLCRLIRRLATQWPRPLPHLHILRLRLHILRLLPLLNSLRKPVRIAWKDLLWPQRLPVLTKP